MLPFSRYRTTICSLPFFPAYWIEKEIRTRPGKTMPFMRDRCKFVLALLAISLFSLVCPCCRAQAALLLEEPYGFFGALNPTGHTAIYFEHICAETPVRLRPCQPGELGAVISRYQGIGNYDWLAVPLLPYLYSTENPSAVPNRADRETVRRLRDNYHEAHLETLGTHVPEGSFFHGGWFELVGVAYERRIYAFRFNTTQAQDEAFIARLNAGENISHFDLLYNNCADFTRDTLNFYFPGVFRRSVFPDAGMTTPKQIAFKLTRYARRHPETQLAVFEIPQVPGYRRMSRANKSISESLMTTGYAIPLVAMNPYLAGGILVDYLVRGRFHLIPKHPERLGPTDLAALTVTDKLAQNLESANVPPAGAGTMDLPDSHTNRAATFGMKEIATPHE
jgi:hypothetical protein